MQVGNRFKIGKHSKNKFSNQKNAATDKNNPLSVYIGQFKFCFCFNSFAPFIAFIGGVIKIECTYTDCQDCENQKNEHF